MHKLLMTAAMLLALTGAVAAETCTGTLIHRDDGWFIEYGSVGGLCEFRNQTMVNRVRAVCSEDQGCKVTGTIIDCKGDGECREVRSVQRVERTK
jgi:hypothetical protein